MGEEKTVQNQQRSQQQIEQSKRLDFLYHVATLLNQNDRSLEQLCQAMVVLLPGCRQHLGARITLGDQMFSSPDFRECECCQRSVIVVDGKTVGAIDVCYGQELPEGPEAPFLKEAQIVLDTISQQLAFAFRRRQAPEEAPQHSTLCAHPHAIIVTDDHFTVSGWNDAAAALYGWQADEALGRSLGQLLPVFAAKKQTAVADLPLHENSLHMAWQERRKDEHSIAVESQITILRAGQGPVQGYLSVHKEIAGRKELPTTFQASLRQLQAVFEHSLDAVVLANDDARYVEVNPAACLLLGYTRDELLQLCVWNMTPGVNREKGQEMWQQFIEAGVLSGEYVVLRKDGSLREVEFRAVANVQPHLHLSVLRDVTERREADRLVRRQAARSEVLLKISQAMTEALLDTPAILETITREIASLVGDACVMVLLDENQQWLEPIAFYHADPETRALLAQLLHLPPKEPTPALANHVLQDGEPIFLPLVTEADIRELFPAEYWNYIEPSAVQSLLIVPVRFKQEIIGLLSLSRNRPGNPYMEEDLIFLLDLADRAGLTISNARLYEQLQRSAAELEQRVAQRTAELSQANVQLQQEIHEREQAEEAEREQRALAQALSESAAVLNQTLDLDEVLDGILENLNDVVPHDVVDIMLLDGEQVRVVRRRGLREDTIPGGQGSAAMNVRDTPILQQMMKSGKGIAIPDTAAEKRWSHTLQLEALRSYAGAPIRQNGETIGFLHLGSRTPDFYRSEHARRLDAFANHAAIALRNAQLYLQAQELAAFQERQRLARELHDAVLQTLWSTTIMADVLPQMWQRDPLKGAERLQRLKQLTRGALAEMRALLVELRPAALAEIKLEELLQLLLEATGSRTNASIHFNVNGSDELLPHVRHAFYRIAQEALHNIVRHSNASQIQLELYHEQFVVELLIVDNGEGFILEQVPPGHMGLSIMRERAEEIRADFEVSTRLYEGTTVRVTWPRQESFEG